MPMDEWEIRPEDLSPAQREVAELIGFENYLKLIDVYAAETIYIPKRDSFERIARNQRMPTSLAAIFWQASPSLGWRGPLSSRNTTSVAGLPRHPWAVTATFTCRLGANVWQV